MRIESLWRLVLAITLITNFAMSHAIGLATPDKIDGVFVHPQKLQAGVSLVTELPLDQPEAVKRLEEKANNYITFLKSGQLWAHAPNANRELPVVLVFMFLKNPSPDATQNILRIGKLLKSEGFELVLREY